MRYTPAGLPALDVGLKHESELSENGLPRKVSMEMRAVAIGEVTQSLMAMALGDAALFAGFVTSARNGRGLLFHITSGRPPRLTRPIRFRYRFTEVSHAPTPR
jgi:primosomal replication protein N